VKKIKVIITGATGMVGEGVMHDCLKHDQVEEVLVLSRKPSGITHPKLKEVIHQDFFDLSLVESQLVGYSSCLFCLGVSSIGLSEEKYYHLTYDLTLHAAQVLSRLNPEMTFCYISGVGTDSTEKGKVMWARVKGKTENHILKLPFKAAYMFRPGYLQPIRGLSQTHKFYFAVSWLYPVLRPIISRYACTLEELAHAMIQCSLTGYEKPVLEVKDIIYLANR
jgi:uncharacterized protein YbjT (DUF2867 family)